MRNGIHLLTAALLLLAVASSFALPFTEAALNLLMCAIFAVFYFVGYEQLDRWNEGRQQLWLVTLTGVWIMEMLIAPVGIYLVFPLYFVYLRVMDDLRGVLSVMFATSIAIIVQIPSGLSLGGVMGPAVSAAVTVAIHYAFRTITRINQEREEVLRELVETRNQLAETERAAGMIGERQRLAHEIHDTVAQGLSSIQMLLHAAERDLKDGKTDEEVVERIELARTTAAENLAEARAMIAALQPVALSQSSLATALERMAATFAAAADIEIDVEVDGEERQLPMSTEGALLRIAQGAVGNVAKHSDATRCRVTVTYDEGEVRLDVVDNGTGFDVDEVESRPAGLGHVGLTAMRSRAEEQGGILVVESSWGGPTAVSAALPVRGEVGHTG